MMSFNDIIFNDIYGILDKKDMPFFFRDYLSDKSLCIGSYDSFNLYPSDKKGVLEHFFLGQCEGKDPIHNAFSHLLKWCRLHSENDTKDGLFAVILTDKWDPKSFAQFEDALSLAKNTMPLNIAVILLTGYGASEIKVLL